MHKEDALFHKLVEMNDGESLDLHFFTKDSLPLQIEKRANALLEQFGHTLWELESSYKPI
ncbi:Uncharacterised protein [Exiguobacterium aurantiacum]|uniref:Uncharacterized protein n=1 Tax=Exiguobacterium aurantiacum TaxID=33987 RepID=A0A377FYJ5_9BACL|nr:Uncharacterised protein [Exiguobacterium aurantiacum]